MAVVKPFKAVRPIDNFADKVAALPYDVMNSDEAREMVEGNPYSFLHVDKAEIDLDRGIDLYDKKVYEKARENLQKLISEGTLVKDSKDNMYIYRQIMNGRTSIILTLPVLREQSRTGWIRLRLSFRIGIRKSMKDTT
jgi:uncharacterized protein (DUF1015 family)